MCAFPATRREVQPEDRRVDHQPDRHGRGRPARNRSDHAHRRGPRAVRQAAARKPVLVAQFAGDAGLAGRLGRFERPVPRPGRSRVQLFSVDGQPITDQQSKVFSNQIPVDAVQSMEVIEGAPPAEYGDKTSLVIVVTTRSGLGSDHAARRCHGFLRHFRHPATAASIWLRRTEVGQLHFGQRAEHRPLPRWPGIHGHARPRQRAEPVRPPRFQAVRARTRST